MNTPSDDNERLLIVLPLSMYNSRGRLHLDVQACNGLRLWLMNFRYITLACPTVCVDSPPRGTSPTDSIAGAERLTLVSLPTAYTPMRFFFFLPEVMRTLKRHTETASYLHFAIGGLWGDWASVASLLAIWAKLPFAVWTDNVASQVTEFTSKSKTGFRRSYTLLVARLIGHCERYILRHCALGLFHGFDCFRAYSGLCPNSHLVHDIHVGADAVITPSALKQRFSASGTQKLRLVYAGRVHHEKGVYDWIKALMLSAENGIDFIATWFGSGPELEVARRQVTERGLDSMIEFKGPIEDHSQLIRRLQGFDAFLFCHKLLESPRCLIEALLCGLPIVGYETDYSSDLIRINGGGLLTPKDDIRQLSNSIALLSGDRKLLQSLSERAVLDGSPLTDESVFRHRSELIKAIRVLRRGLPREDSRNAAVV